LSGGGRPGNPPQLFPVVPRAYSPTKCRLEYWAEITARDDGPAGRRHHSILLAPPAECFRARPQRRLFSPVHRGFSLSGPPRDTVPTSLPAGERSPGWVRAPGGRGPALETAGSLKAPVSGPGTGPRHGLPIGTVGRLPHCRVFSRFARRVPTFHRYGSLHVRDSRWKPFPEVLQPQTKSLPPLS